MQDLNETRPVIAIIGRANVGKSTLFNLLSRKALALVHDQPGITRDRREASAMIEDYPVCLIDTPGFEDEKNSNTLTGKMQAQALKAIKMADVILFVIDARHGLMPLDHIFAEKLYKVKKPVLVLANKCETHQTRLQAHEAYGLGFGEVFPVSAAHNLGFGEVRDAIKAQILKDRPEYSEREAGEGDLEEDNPDENLPLRLAVVGRPNAGKSTLVNRLIGEERMITGEEAGITRDAISLYWSWKGQDVRLVDTAGLRKKSRISDPVEKSSVEACLRAVRLAEIVLLVSNATQVFEKQDLFIMSRIIREGRGLVFVCTHWDEVKDKGRKLTEIKEKMERFMPESRGVKLLTVSGITGEGIKTLMPALMETWANWKARVKTSDLNQWLDWVVQKKQPPMVQGRRPKLKYISQIKARPPSFVIKGSRVENLHESYKRYLSNELIKNFDLYGASVRLIYRSNENPYQT